MPYREIRLVLNNQAMEEIEKEVRKAVRTLYPGIVITQRDGEGSPALVLDVQGLSVDTVSKETFFESKGEEVALEYDHALRAELGRFL